MNKMNKKGQIFSQLASMAIGIAVVAIILVVTFIVIAQGQEQIGDIEGLSGVAANNQSSVAINATNDIKTAVDDIPGWLPLIIITTVGMLLIGLVKAFGKS